MAWSSKDEKKAVHTSGSTTNPRPTPSPYHNAEGWQHARKQGGNAANPSTKQHDDAASLSDDDKNKNSQATPSGRPDTRPHARSSPTATLTMATGPDGPMRQLIRAELDNGNAMNPYYKYFQGGNIHESLQTQNLCR